jgi:hypothetical protein
MPVVRQAKLKVVQFPQNDNYVPGIRVAGRWLAELGFPYGTEVQLTASEGRIIIERKGVRDEADVAPPNPKVSAIDDRG